MRSSRLDHFIILLCQFFSTFGLMVLIPIMPLYMEKLTAHMSAPTIWAGLALAAPAIGSLLPHRLWDTYPKHSAIKKPCYFLWLVSVFQYC